MRFQRLQENLRKVSDLSQLDRQVRDLVIDRARRISPVDSGAFKSGWSIRSDGDLTIWLRPQNDYIDQGYTRNGAGTVKSPEWNGTPYSTRAIRETMPSIMTLVRNHLEKIHGD